MFLKTGMLNSMKLMIGYTILNLN